MSISSNMLSADNVMVPLDRIATDKKGQTRVNVRPAVVREYAAAMAEQICGSAADRTAQNAARRQCLRDERKPQKGGGRYCKDGNARRHASHDEFSSGDCATLR